jgi:hypothetical protein
MNDKGRTRNQIKFLQGFLLVSGSLPPVSPAVIHIWPHSRLDQKKLTARHILDSVLSQHLHAGKPEMALISAFFGSVMPKEFGQKRLKISFPVSLVLP